MPQLDTSNEYNWICFNEENGKISVLLCLEKIPHLELWPISKSGVSNIAAENEIHLIFLNIGTCRASLHIRSKKVF